VSDYNRTIIVGNLTRDPELRYTAGNKAVCNFTIASNRKYKGKEEATFLDIIAWGKTAETIAEYMKKGSKILLEGSLIQDSWETKKGEKRTKIKLNLNSFSFMDTGS